MAAPNDTEALASTIEEVFSRLGIERRRKRAPLVLGARSSENDLALGKRVLAALASHGLSTPRWPLEYGGAGLGTEAARSLQQIIGEYEVPDLYPFLVGTELVGPALIAHGTCDQQQRWLTAIRTGDEIWCQLFSEPDAGSDLASLSTQARREGDGWRVTGQKVWSSRAHYSKWGMLLARTGSAADRHRGITAFAVPMNAAGISVSPLTQMNGDDHFSVVFLDSVWIPDGDLIGTVGGGWNVAMQALAHERGGFGSRQTDLTRHDILEITKLSPEWAAARGRQRVVAAVIEHEVARLTLLRAADDPPRRQELVTSAAKLRAARLTKEVTSLALEALGASGMLGAGPWADLFLVSPSMSIRGGTDEIQKNILAERVLGLPREPMPSRSTSND